MTFDRLIELVYLMLLAYGANMTPPFIKYWRGWNRPIARRWLGDHKTIVGFAAGVAVGVIFAFVQSRIESMRPLWARESWPLAGFAAGSGAMLGDSAKSFFKRRLGLAPGTRWIPFDQLDFAAGALIAFAPFVTLGALDVIALLVFTFAADVAVNHLSSRLGIRDTKW